MRLYIDIASRKLIEQPGFRQPVTLLEFKRGDSLALEVQFMDGLTVVELAEAATGRFGLKVRNAYDGDFVVSALSWTKSGSGAEALYRFDPSFNTVELNAALNASTEFVDLMGEIEWGVSGTISSSATFTARVHNDVIRGDEGVPQSGTPVYPLPDELLIKSGNLAGLADSDAARTNLGLGNLPNFPVAQQELAEAGTDAASLMTPLGTAQAIAAQGLPRLIEVANTAARFARTGLRNGDFVKEAGAAEITQITCPGSVFSQATQAVWELQAVASAWMPGAPAVVEITCAANSSGSLWGLHLSLRGGQYYCWASDEPQSVAVDPAPPGSIGIRFGISDNATAEDVATSLAAAVDALPEFHATASGDVVTITEADPGWRDSVVLDTLDGTGFSINQVSNGEDPYRGALQNEEIYFQSPSAWNYVSVSSLLTEGVSYTAAEIAELIDTEVNGISELSAETSGSVVTVTFAEAGVSSIWTNTAEIGCSEITPGVDAAHQLSGKSFTLYNGSNVARTVGFNTGTINVSLPPENQSSAQVAALVRDAIDVHADFIATAAEAVVTVTNATIGSATDANMGASGFMAAVTQQGVAPTNLVFEVINATATASEAGFSPVQGVIGFIGRRNSWFTIAQSTSGGNITGFTTVHDSHAGYNTSTGFTIPRSGKWLVGLRMSLCIKAGGATAACLVRGGVGGIPNTGHFLGHNATLYTFGSTTGLSGSVVEHINQGAVLQPYLSMYYAPTNNDIWITDAHFWAIYLGP